MAVVARVAPGPGDQGKLQGDARPEYPFRDVRKAFGMANHKLMDIEKHQEHENDSAGGESAGGGREQTEAAEDFRPSAEPDERRGV